MEHVLQVESSSDDESEDEEVLVSEEAYEAGYEVETFGPKNAGKQAWQRRKVKSKLVEKRANIAFALF